MIDDLMCLFGESEDVRLQKEIIEELFSLCVRH